ncbi:MAG: hypothetical protein AABY85_13445 [Gemmatimonadota bacterium]|jgi:hypothetical protein
MHLSTGHHRAVTSALARTLDHPVMEIAMDAARQRGWRANRERRAP